MPLSAEALTTWARAQSVLNLSADDEAKVEFLIDAASAFANQRAGRSLKAREVDLRLDGPRGSSLVLPEAPATVDKLWLDVSRVFADGDELEADEFDVLQGPGIVRLYAGTFPQGMATVRVVGTFGYDPVPADLEQAVIECVAVNLRRTGSPAAIGLKNVSVDGAMSSAYEVDWPTTAVRVFDSYRWPSV